MATMLSEVYDALRDAQGVTEEKARKAAEAVAAFDARFGAIENGLTRINGEVGLLRWMVGFGLALSVAILLKLFVH
jgi:hypothetical protein